MHSSRPREKERQEVVTVATAMLDGKMHLIEGVRRLTELQNHVGNPGDPIFLPIRAIESETDHFPLGAMRTQCSSDYLLRMDDEMNEYLTHASADILAACRRIVQAYAGPAPTSV